MPLPKELTTVTPLSKAVALLLFILLPILSFLFGMNYQTIVNNINNVLPQQKGCTYDAKICPDGSSVGRLPPSCEFAPCPTVSQKENKIPCSNARGLKCPEGYYCDTRQFPDASGICVKLEDNKGYQCPESGYVDCMPGPNNPKLRWECTAEFLQWAQVNCPGFQGAAY